MHKRLGHHTGRTIALALVTALAGVSVLVVPASAAVTTVNVSSLAVVFGGKASGTVSGFAPATAVTIEGQTYAADASGTVSLFAVQLTFDSQLSVEFVDSDGDRQAAAATLRSLVDGSVLTPAQLFDLAPDATEPSSTTVGQPTGSGDGGDGASSGGGGDSSGGGSFGAGAGSGGTAAGPPSAATPTSGAAGALPVGAVRLTNGISIPASSVAPPHKLVVARVLFTPNVIRSRRRPFTALITITDTRGYLVRDALVFLRGVPERRIARALERRTASDGTVTFTLRGTKMLPLRRGARLTLFVRARASAAGPAVTRLVSIRITKPAVAER